MFLGSFATCVHCGISDGDGLYRFRVRGGCCVSGLFCHLCTLWHK